MDKIVYIAHPINGDIDNNLEKIYKIIRRIAGTREETVPFAPYIAYLKALDDDNEIHRRKGLIYNNILISRKFVDEIWLYGSEITSGMEMEIRQAHIADIPVIPQTAGTKIDYDNLEDLC